ncbi:site-specific DNA-methyltransferase (plasmid) [Acinetobacter lwoffii]|jgi:adenine-specific DNA-methyltransferase|uniref:site-specific DNA-methyltransferase (adenine-specific) n=1 Tax=Acinetobacter johnsonii TaxID=40214 RepID=A0A3R9ETH1_ACIJO|nr:MULTISPECIES: site-specific DNA-methyltransferase [Acinetobacter]MCJ9206828.1 site-specific DNA-methyltransferase [Acinetobacter baumannii]MCJ9331128.1 site-specific DNA-methyltransferase [Acinetobacter baumannii]MCJ9528582.1 site-specific DNA-methyltransferase [Acinetobacter baumannii]MDE9412764.1 site-specific DNA-methyltransferase [Acinetobacter nosocomialis]MEB8382970.1 site-specific DNA-methyltransferase [Acinetobacter junii]
MAENSLKKGQYTRFSNKIGLYSANQENVGFIKNNSNVVINFPFKDAVLVGGMSREDVKTTEKFLHQEVDSKDIDTLFEPKVLTNPEYYSATNETEFEFFDENGELKENLLIKGNNLLALYSLREKLANKVKLLYLDPPYNTENDGFKYNDTFTHSSWLLFIKNRLEVVKDLLKEDGLVFIQCDDNEQAYLKVLADEVFGRENYLNQVSVKMKQTSGASGGGEDKRLKKNIEYILIYTKNMNSENGFKKFNDFYDEVELFEYLETMKQLKKSWKYTRILKSVGTKEHIKTLTDGSGEPIEVYTHKGVVLEPIKKVMEEENLTEVECYLKYFDKIMRDTNAQSSIRTRVMEGVTGDHELLSIEYVPRSGKNKNKVTTVYYKGAKCDQIAWLSDIAVKRGKYIFKLEKAGTFWDGFPLNNLTKEGGVLFPNGKKPELLLQRIIEIATDEGDLVLDFFSGSGTTAAVAHKLGRKWIAIEQMDYIDEITKTRLKRVINGEDGGISKLVNWNGGGSFVYFELKRYNQAYQDGILAATSKGELDSIYNEMAQNAFLKFWFDKKDFEREESFRALSLDDRKVLLLQLLDENQLYLNHADMLDSKFKVTQEEIALTDKFYGASNV